MDTNLDAVIHLRLDTRDKELWVKAAGGERKLSAWIRDRCNAAATGTDGRVSHRPEAGVSSPSPAPSVPVTAAPTGRPRSRTKPKARPPAPAKKPVRQTGVCANERFHRPGTYCKVCDTVP